LLFHFLAAVHSAAERKRERNEMSNNTFENVGEFEAVDDQALTATSGGRSGWVRGAGRAIRNWWRGGGRAGTVQGGTAVAIDEAARAGRGRE
jgi:hypothetical protein